MCQRLSAFSLCSDLAMDIVKFGPFQEAIDDLRLQASVIGIRIHHRMRALQCGDEFWHSGNIGVGRTRRDSQSDLDPPKKSTAARFYAAIFLQTVHEAVRQ